jgi:hypothetical protein
MSASKILTAAIGLVMAVASYVQFNKSQELAIPFEVSNMFQTWITKFGKNYQTPEEIQHRLSVFYHNYLLVTEFNSKHKRGAVLGLSKFADLHPDEFLPGSQKSTEASKIKREKLMRDAQESRLRNPKVFQPTPNTTNVTDINWELGGPNGTSAWLPPIGSQDMTNYCNFDSQAFGWQALATAAHALTNNVTKVDVSSQWILDCKLQDCDYETSGYPLIGNVNLPL